MPKYTMAFNMPFEQQEWEDACSGGSYLGLLHDWDNFLRNEVKYREDKPVKWSVVRTLFLSIADQAEVQVWK